MMLTRGGFPPSLCNTTPHETLSLPLPFPTKTHLSFLPNGLTDHRICPILTQIRTNLNFCVSALKSRRKGGNTHSVTNSLDDEEFEDEIDDEEEEEEEEEEEFIPLRSMKEWYANKPRGFGEGKVYDTSIEDKLAAEIEKSRIAQLANINKLKNNPQTSKSSKGVLQKQRAPEDVPSGIRVRLVNLPKKRNIHRDLQLAFKGFPGIIDVIPAVSGSKKTRDPICKGFAFVDLKSEADANRFVKSFSRQSITFGKLQKQVRCEIINPKSPSSALKLTPDGNDRAPHVAISSLGKSPVAKFDRVNDTSSNSCELIAPDDSENENDEYVPAQWEEVGENLESFSVAKGSVGDSLVTRTKSVSVSMLSKQKIEVPAQWEEVGENLESFSLAKGSVGDSLVTRTKSVSVSMPSKQKIEVPAQWEEVGENLESFSLAKGSVGDSLVSRTESVSVSMPSKKKEKVLENGKKLKAKRKRTNAPKVKLPGSANRLRVKEKAVLTGVFSKYAAAAVQAASASKGKP